MIDPLPLLSARILLIHPRHTFYLYHVLFHVSNTVTYSAPQHDTARHNTSREMPALPNPTPDPDPVFSSAPPPLSCPHRIRPPSPSPSPPASRSRLTKADLAACAVDVRSLLREKLCHPLMIRLAWHDAGSTEYRVHSTEYIVHST